MEVETNPGQDSVQVSFKTSGSVSCIKNYNIKICEPGQDCAETKTVQKSDAIDFISETVEGLKQCTDYQVRSPTKLFRFALAVFKKIQTQKCLNDTFSLFFRD